MAGYFDASATDQILADITREPASRDFVVVVHFDTVVDEHALQSAWAETLLRHPILAAERWPLAGPPGWRPCDRGADSGAAVGRMAVRAGASGTSVELSFDHAAVDARAGLYCLETLRDRFRFRSVTRAPDLTPRTLTGAISQFGFSDARARRAFESALGRWSELEPSEHHRPPGVHAAEEPDLLRFGLDIAATARFQRLARGMGMPMTAALAAALSCAWERAGGSGIDPTRCGWGVTFDLRPLLGMTGGIGNLSGIDAICSRVWPGDIEATLRAGAAAFANLRDAYPGLASQLIAEQGAALLRPPYASPVAARGMGLIGRRTGYTRILSNLGSIPATMADWGDVRVRDAHVIPPLHGLAYHVFAVSSFGGELSVVLRFAGSRLGSEFLSQLDAALQATFAEAASLDAAAV